jgi:addiction module RelB/DinJ family antitoxin
MNTQLQKVKNIQVRIDADLSNKANKILYDLGISPNQVIKMLYSQIVIQKKIPFDLIVPDYYEFNLTPDKVSSVGRSLKQIKNRQYTIINGPDELYKLDQPFKSEHE